MISERTKAALAAAKARGVKLGNPNGARALRDKQVGNRQAVAAVRANAEHRAANLRAIVDDLRSQEFTSVRTIANQLNERGILTPRGGEWHPTSAARLLSRLQRDGDTPDARGLAMSLSWPHVWSERPHQPHFTIFAKACERFSCVQRCQFPNKVSSSAFHSVPLMSALPPKADIRQRSASFIR
jgi:hypothetical protein